MSENFHFVPKFGGQISDDFYSHLCLLLRLRMSLSTKEEDNAFQKLGDTNYQSWSDDLSDYLMEKGLAEFIGDVEPEVEKGATPKEVREFNRRRDKALGILKRSVTREYKDLVRTTKTPKEAWDLLQKTYEPSSHPRIAYLRMKFNTAIMNANEEMVVYLSRVDAIVQQLRGAGGSAPDSEVAYQYLQGLPEDYEFVKIQIQGWPDADFIPSKIRTFLIGEYGRRRYKTEAPSSNSQTSAFATSSRGARGQRGGQNRNRGVCHNCGDRGHFYRQCPHPPKSSVATAASVPVPVTTPSRGRGRGRGNRRGQFRGPGKMATFYVSTIVSESTMNTMNTNLSNFSSLSATNGNSSVMNSSVNSCDLENEWYIDSGATDHVCGDRKLFKSLKNITPFSIEQGEGSAQATGVGCVELQAQFKSGVNTVTLDKVCYVKGFRKNLISLRKIDEAGFNITICNGTLRVFETDPRDSLFIARLQSSKLYRFVGSARTLELTSVTPMYENCVRVENSIVPKSSSQPMIDSVRSYSDILSSNLPIEQSDCQTETETQIFDLSKYRVVAQTAVISTCLNASLGTWHARMMHQNQFGIRKLAQSQNVHGLEMTQSADINCSACAQSKSTRASFKPIEGISTSRQLQLIHMDLWGPSSVVSAGGARYFMSLIDDYSRYTTLFILKTKNEALPKFKEFNTLMKNRYGEGVVAIRSDNGTEFCSKEFDNYLKTEGIEHQLTNTYSPEMNGVAERINRTIIEGVRSVLVETNLPKNLWAELTMAFVYLKNRFPHKKLGYKTPYVLWHEHGFSVRHLRRIGSKCYVNIPFKKRTSKLNRVAWEGVLVGYATHTRGFRVWNPVTGLVDESKHVTIDELTLYNDPNFSTEIKSPMTVIECDKNSSAWKTISKRKPKQSKRQKSKQYYRCIEKDVSSGDESSEIEQPETPPSGISSLVQLPPISPVPSLLLTPFSGSISSPVLSLPTPKRTGLRLEHAPETVEGPQKSVKRKALKDVIETWVRKEKVRESGKTKGHVDVYYYPPNSKRLRSYVDVFKFCDRENISFVKSLLNFKPIGNNRSSETHEDFIERMEEANEDNVQRVGFEDLSLQDDFALEPEVAFHGDDDNSDFPHQVQINLCCITEPMTFEEAIKTPEKKDWENAMNDEIDTLIEREVFEECVRPQSEKTVGCKWIFKLKRSSDGAIKRYRARLVAQGFRQTLGIDYDEIFSPVVNFVVIQLLFVLLVILRGWAHTQLDVKCAYLYGDLKEKIFMDIPKGWRTKNNENNVWRLKKALYGLHQSGRQWFIKLDEELRAVGFRKMLGINCVYVYEDIAYLLVYVDDIVVFSKDSSISVAMVEKLKSCFNIVELGEVNTLLGVQFQIKDGKVKIHQKPYIEKLAKRFKVDEFECNRVKVPIAVGSVFELPDKDSQDEQFPYRSLVGSLLFLARRTRPDIMFAVILLSQYNTSHNSQHINALMQILKYVVKTKDFAIDLSSCTDSQLVSYSDASWASDRDSRKSFGGHIVFLGHVPISWGCVKQKAISLSVMESEYMALTDCAKETRWLYQILERSGCIKRETFKPVIYVDNQAAIDFVRNPIENTRTKHIDIRYHFIRSWYNLSYFKLLGVRTEFNIADIFTKFLSKERIEFLCSSIFTRLDT